MNPWRTRLSCEVFRESQPSLFRFGLGIHSCGVELPAFLEDHSWGLEVLDEGTGVMGSGRPWRARRGIGE
jgi:hypothetical protein